MYMKTLFHTYMDDVCSSHRQRAIVKVQNDESDHVDASSHFTTDESKLEGAEFHKGSRT